MLLLRAELISRPDMQRQERAAIHKAYQAGLAGIAVEAGASYMLDKEEVVDAANKMGLFLLGFKAPDA